MSQLRALTMNDYSRWVRRLIHPPHRHDTTNSLLMGTRAEGQQLQGNTTNGSTAHWQHTVVYIATSDPINVTTVPLPGVRWAQSPYKIIAHVLYEEVYGLWPVSSVSVWLLGGLTCY